ncbi:serine/threonine-protein kinase [Streptomyces sp. BK239]|uniref:serine/threonine-protein kinase n=1 Tax=Streptomyces sp. BK239 TaxID=2512155 RepID=UPI00102C9E00|nr:serine/threonine-protein kinase [Streptomyces sp. BK239]RZU25187.1 serine/threonine protein kinase [Streptomyces sp. BK239]
MKPLDTDVDPRVVGPFELLARLGEGGMGVAYLARTIPLDGLADELVAAYNLMEPDGDAADESRLVVVKMIQPDLLDGDPQYRARFGMEIDAVRAVVSGRVPALIAFEEDPAAERPWFAMDYVAGPSLHTMVKESGTFGIGPYAALGLGLVEALQAIHGARLLHRDLKPSNVVLGPYGPVVLDFGLAVLSERQSSAALTRTGDRMGTRPYMPVEQLRDTKHVKEPADVYALGATLFFALTGRPPYPVMPLTSPPKWDGVDTAYLPLLAQILVANPLQRPDLEAVRESLLTLLADADLTPVLAAEQLGALVESAALTPQLPLDALADPVGPGVRELARQAIDADLPDVDPGFYGIVDTEEIEFAVDGAEPAPAPPTPRPATEPAPQPIPPPAPQPVPTSYPLAPPHPRREPQPTAPPAPPRAAQKVAADLRRRYAHRGNL